MPGLVSSLLLLAMADVEVSRLVSRLVLSEVLPLATREDDVSKSKVLLLMLLLMVLVVEVLNLRALLLAAPEDEVSGLVASDSLLLLLATREVKVPSRVSSEALLLDKAEVEVPGRGALLLVAPEEIEREVSGRLVAGSLLLLLATRDAVEVPD